MSVPANTQPRSTSAQPDLDWSQVRETVMMLYLAVAQIEVSMSEGDESVNSLTDSFTSMAGGVQTIEMAAGDLPDSDELKAIRETILHTCTTVSAKMAASIVAFQFYDKLHQRLAHVNHSLSALADLVSDSTRLYNPYEWRGLQEKIKSKYSMREELAMFDAILRGASVREAMDLVRHQADAAAEDDADVELF
ncbi:MAG: hypothetical protein KDH88_07230 [Chromatiales bacterium]|nr:hypothetical protein [Chromatiales bacterium]